MRKYKKKQKIKLALFILGAVSLILLVGNAFKFVNSLFQPTDLSFGTKESSWDGSSNLYLAAKFQENVSLLVFNPGENKVSVVNLPPQTFMEVPAGLGFWQVRAIFDLGERRSSGSQLLQKSLSSFFGLPIDGFLQFNSKPSEVIKQLKSNPLTGLKINLKGNLTIFELARLYFGLSKVRSDKILEYDLLSLAALQSENLADGSQVFIPTSSLDSFVAERLSDPKIKKEQLSVAVLNGTGQTGLAQKIAREITNLGGAVIIADNTDKNANTFVFGQDSFTKKRLSQILKSKYDKIPTSASRAQVTVVLGEDLKIQ